MYVYKNIPRHRGLCPEEQYSKRWPKLEDLRLTIEPPSMGSTWREEFYPEDYLDPEYCPVHKLLNLKVKEAKLQSRSTKPGGNVQPLNYDQRVIICCRRLAKSAGNSYNGRPDRSLLEDLKERFWYKSIYANAHHKDAERLPIGRHGSSTMCMKH